MVTKILRDLKGKIMNTIEWPVYISWDELKTKAIEAKLTYQVLKPKKAAQRYNRQLKAASLELPNGSPATVVVTVGPQGYPDAIYCGCNEVDDTSNFDAFTFMLVS